MKIVRNSAVVLLCLFLLGGCNNREKEVTDLIRKVKLAEVCRADSLEQIIYPGIISERKNIGAAFRVAGPLESVEVEVGDYVSKGELLARIDQRDYRVQLLAAQGQYDQVKAEAERVIELHDRKSIAGNDYDKAVAGVKMAEANLENAKNQLNDTRLLAPVSGYIQEVNFREGEMVNAGMPVASLIDVSGYQIEIDVPAELYQKRNEFIGFTANMPGASGSAFPLEITGITPKANNNQLYTIRLRPSGSSIPQMAPGMNIRVSVSLSTGLQNIHCVPLNSVFEREGASYVWVYNPEKGVVNSRQITTGRLTGENLVTVTSGLQPGEQVVAAGVHNLQENRKVEVMQPVSESNVGGLL